MHLALYFLTIWAGIGFSSGVIMSLFYLLPDVLKESSGRYLTRTFLGAIPFCILAEIGVLIVMTIFGPFALLSLYGAWAEDKK